MNMYFKTKKENYEEVKIALLEAGVSFEEVPFLADELILREVKTYLEDNSKEIEALRMKYADNVVPEVFIERLTEELVDDISNHDENFFGDHENVRNSIEHLFSMNDESVEYIRSGKLVSFK